MPRTTWRFALAKTVFKQAERLAPLTNLPILGDWYHRNFCQEDEGTFIPVDQAIEGHENIVLPSGIVRRAVETASHRFLVNTCLCREAENCVSYPHDLGCIFLGPATTSISPRLGRQVSVEEALAHLDKCEKAGLVHLFGHYKFDALLLDARPHTRLVSICSCCDCCCIFRVYPSMCPPIGDTLKKLDGVEVTVGDDCVACWACAETCFVKAISIQGEKAVISDQCRGCGRCVTACPNGAITLTAENAVLPEHFLDRIR